MVEGKVIRKLPLYRTVRMGEKVTVIYATTPPILGEMIIVHEVARDVLWDAKVVEIVRSRNEYYAKVISRRDGKDGTEDEDTVRVHERTLQTTPRKVRRKF